MRDKNQNKSYIEATHTYKWEKEHQLKKMQPVNQKKNLLLIPGWSGIKLELVEI
jgi:hypothetical protein